MIIKSIEKSSRRAIRNMKMDAAGGTRVSPAIQPPKRNNFVQSKKGGHNIIQRIKYLIWFQAFLGIIRVYLIERRKCVRRFCYFYNAIYVISAITAIAVVELYSTSHFLFKNTVGIEYLILSFSATFVQRKPLNEFFSKLQSLDEELNICEDIKLTSPIRFYVIGICATILYSTCEHILFLSYTVYKSGTKYEMYAASMGLIAHDVEMIFFAVLLVLVLRRLRVIKAHVAKIFAIRIDKEDNEEIKKLEALSKKVYLDVSSLHKAYDSLYKCSQQLNSIMTFPITVMLVTAGLSTILILKTLINLMQTEQEPQTLDDTTIQVVVTIGVGRSVKHIILLMFPCYYANLTRTQVDIICTMLHDILNDNDDLDKVERRKLKAFVQMCQDNAFLYQMWGVVRLDMSLPLDYSSLCTTYLIIFVQFSKFID